METQQIQQGLNEVVQNKVDRMIVNRKSTVDAAVARLINEGKNSQDFITEIGSYKKVGATPDVIFLEDGNKLTMNLGNSKYSIHSNAVSQLATKMDIPTKYLRELSEGPQWQKKLAVNILNEHSGWSDRNRVLVRTVGTEVRGVLSDSYRRLNSMDIITAFLSSAIKQGGVPCDALMTDTKIFVETILPQPICIPTKLNGNVIVYMGARFSTSDYGDGAVDMRAFLLNGVCLNGMVRESVMKQVHLGSKLPDNLQLSERTYRYDTKTTMSLVKDLTANIYSADNIKQKAYEIQAASSEEVDFDNELKKLIKGNKIQKTEQEGIQKLLMNSNPEDGLNGAASLWKLTQGITAYARQLTPSRARELHEISGDLLARVS